jgi:hypothetical protein
MRNQGLWLAAVLMGVSAVPAHAMRCGNQLVLEGMTRYEVRERCGEPDDKSKRYATVYRRTAIDETVAVEIEIEEWFYDGGSTKLDRHLKFIDGRLDSESAGSD